MIIAGDYVVVDTTTHAIRREENRVIADAMSGRSYILAAYGTESEARSIFAGIRHDLEQGRPYVGIRTI